MNNLQIIFPGIPIADHREAIRPDGQRGVMPHLAAAVHRGECVAGRTSGITTVGDFEVTIPDVIIADHRLAIRPDGQRGVIPRKPVVHRRRRIKRRAVNAGTVDDHETAFIIADHRKTIRPDGQRIEPPRLDARVQLCRRIKRRAVHTGTVDDFEFWTRQALIIADHRIPIRPDR